MIPKKKAVERAPDEDVEVRFRTVSTWFDTTKPYGYVARLTDVLAFLDCNGYTAHMDDADIEKLLDVEVIAAVSASTN